ncbi:MAG: bifunctional UDP-N-acetylglucosamine diphosphorylase/glucosamine-1-phosphate N-acetyltransferase GlmU [Chloroflexi bacterium]|nr:bifunctional UDP-N-acetylglucosamine diphosphorylase/glucosamine-1-phosphate N-acetyltransferase GlmU [Chloroflexota bacterium]
MSALAGIVLAAGRGTRMKSKRPKVLHEAAGRPLLAYALETLRRAGLHQLIVVVGYGADEVRAAIGDGVRYALQVEQRGTGHAVAQALSLLENDGDAVVCYGDMPLIRAETIAQLLVTHREASATLTLLTAELADPAGYGRIVRDQGRRVREIVEEAAATAEQRAIRETNSGIYCFQTGWLRMALPRIPLSAKGEYYLTDAVRLAIADGVHVAAVRGDPAELVGVNDRVQLAEVGALLRARILRRLMLGGVTVVDPATTYVDAGVEIGPDTVLHPNTTIRGRSRIAEDCEIGPNSYVVDSEIGRGSRVWASVLESATVGRGVRLGPFAHLRPGAVVGDGCEIGNYAEIKNSRLGPGTRMHHFSYIGDASLGREVNVGAGTITCNFDSETGQKSRTVVGDRAALGSDTMLVAPVEVGAGAITGAGSVVTRDIPPAVVALGVPARVARETRPRQRRAEDDASLRPPDDEELRGIGSR